MKKESSFSYILLTILSAFIYAFSIPILNLIGNSVPTLLKNAMMFLGARFASLLLLIFNRFKNYEYIKYSKKDIFYTFLVSIVEVAASTCFILGISKINSETSSMLFSFQAIFTALISLVMFKEKISVLGWIGILFLFGSAISLSFNDNGFIFNESILLIIVSVALWSLENNLARKVENISSSMVVMFKSFLTFFVMLIASSFMGETSISLCFPSSFYLFILGFFVYGISIFLLFLTQKKIGVGLAGSYFSIFPCFSAIISLLIFKNTPYFTFYISLGLLIPGIIILTIDQYRKARKLR